MLELSADAYGKINLTLDVINRRPDGYHNVKTVLQSVSFSDRVCIKRNSNNRSCPIEVRSNLPYVPTDKRNIAFAAASEFFEYTGVHNDGVSIKIEKNIPVAAGLAGGSANGAVVLKLLNRLFETGLSDRQLCEIGAKCGSDVPFCIMGGTMLATGRGEKLERLNDAPKLAVVLCTPSFSVSTPLVYKMIDSRKIKIHPDTDGMVSAVNSGSMSGIASRVYNVMETVVTAMKKTVSEIHSTLMELGADGASMSGSGPTVFGLFGQRSNAEKAADILKADYKNVNLAEFQSKV